LKRVAVEAFRGGSRGAAHEFTLHARSWKTDVRTIAMAVHMWHGDQDAIVRVETARWLAGQLPDARATWLAGEGHLLFVDHAEEVMRVVAEAAGR
jgi:pimeloyl-ACP methyl ester carboxylesterase